MAFAVLMVLGGFLSGGDAPDYAVADEDWTDWADDNQSKSGIGAFLVVAAMGFAALLGAAGLLTLRSGVFARWIGIVALLGAVAAKTACLPTAFFPASWSS